MVFSPFPLSELTLCFFATYLAEQRLTPSTIKPYLAAVCNVQISLGLPDPRDQSSCPVLKRVLAGISQAHLSKGTHPRVCLPITTPLIVMIGLALNSTSDPSLVPGIHRWRKECLVSAVCACVKLTIFIAPFFCTVTQPYLLFSINTSWHSIVE